MTITKYGHCCLLIEVDGKRLLTDPGVFSHEYESLPVDVILITHEHADHCHTDSIKTLVEKNPEVTVVSNHSVAALLKRAGIEARVLEGRDAADILGIALEAFDGPHAEIFESFGLVQNTGYLVANTFFYPGDGYTLPEKPVSILGLPVAGPWCKLSDALHYALTVKPKVAIPVHDAVLSEEGKHITYAMCERQLATHGITFTPLTDGKAQPFQD